MAQQNHKRTFRVYTETGNNIPLDRFSNVFRTAVYAPDPEGCYSHAVAFEVQGYTTANGRAIVSIEWPGHPERNQTFEVAPARQ